MMKTCDAQCEETNVDSAKSTHSCDNKCHKVVKIQRKENTNAKNRWRLLARAILSRDKMKVKENTLLISGVSQDGFSGFDLVEVKQQQLNKDDSETLMLIIDIGCNKYDCSVHIEKLWTMKDLIGFNNTGNIKFWASEAALTYFVLDNLQMFNDSWVMELGGGMFCLAGLMLAKYSGAFAVHLSDGNQSSLNNVRKSVKLNDTRCFVKSSGICNTLGWLPCQTNSFVQFSDGKRRQRVEWSIRNTISF